MKKKSQPKTRGLSISDLQTSIGRGAVAPVYLFAGGEQFIADEAIGLLVDSVITAESRSFNLDIVYGSEVQSHEVLSISSAYPMIGDRRMVVVKEFDKLSKPELLTEYINAPLDTTVLILVSEKPDFRKNPFRIFDDSSILNCAPLYENQIPAWITGRMSRLKKQIAPDAATALAGYVGTSLRQIANEIEKLDIYTADRNKISLADVNAVVGQSKAYNIFELQKAIGQKDAGTAIHIIERMIERGESPVMIISMLTRFFIGLLKLHDLVSRNIARIEMAREIGVNAFFLNDHIDHLKNHAPQRFPGRFRALLEADLLLKSTGHDPRQILSILLFKLIDKEDSHTDASEFVQVVSAGNDYPV